MKKEDENYCYIYHEQLGGWEAQLNPNVDIFSFISAPPLPDIIDGKPLLITKNLFSGCRFLETAPEIPIYAEDISGMFNGCKNLRTYEGSDINTMDYDFSQYYIPETVKTMSECFKDVQSLTLVPDIPENVKDAGDAYAGCSALQKMPTVYSDGDIKKCKLGCEEKFGLEYTKPKYMSFFDKLHKVLKKQEKTPKVFKEQETEFQQEESYGDTILNHTESYTTNVQAPTLHVFER